MLRWREWSVADVTENGEVGPESGRPAGDKGTAGFEHFPMVATVGRRSDWTPGGRHYATIDRGADTCVVRNDAGLPRPHGRSVCYIASGLGQFGARGTGVVCSASQAFGRHRERPRHYPCASRYGPCREGYGSVFRIARHSTKAAAGRWSSRNRSAKEFARPAAPTAWLGTCPSRHRDRLRTAPARRLFVVASDMGENAGSHQTLGPRPGWHNSDQALVKNMPLWTALAKLAAAALQ